MCALGLALARPRRQAVANRALVSCILAINVAIAVEDGEGSQNVA